MVSLCFTQISLCFRGHQSLSGRFTGAVQGRIGAALRQGVTVTTHRSGRDHRGSQGVRRFRYALLLWSAWEVRFAKPSASRPESSEIYLVCQGFTATVSAGKKLEVLRIVDDLGLWMRIPSQDQSHVCRSFPMRNSFELGGFHRHGTHFHAEEVFPFSPAEMSNLVFWFDVCRVLRIIFPFLWTSCWRWRELPDVSVSCQQCRVSVEARSENLQDGYEKHRECARLENFMAWKQVMRTCYFGRFGRHSEHHLLWLGVTLEDPPRYFMAFPHWELLSMVSLQFAASTSSFARAWLECVAGREKVQPGSPALLERRVEQKGQLCWQFSSWTELS